MSNEHDDGRDEHQGPGKLPPTPPGPGFDGLTPEEREMIEYHKLDPNDYVAIVSPANGGTQVAMAKAQNGQQWVLFTPTVPIDFRALPLKTSSIVDPHTQQAKPDMKTFPPLPVMVRLYVRKADLGKEALVECETTLQRQRAARLSAFLPSVTNSEPP